MHRHFEAKLKDNNTKKAYDTIKILTATTHGRVSTILDKTGKCLTEEQEILKRWTAYCAELYNHDTNEDHAVLNCPQVVEEEDHPILHEEVEAAVKSLKKRRSSGVDNIPAELVQASGDAMIDALSNMCNKIGQTGEWQTP